MSVVSKDSLGAIKSILSECKKGGMNFNDAFYLALRGLESAVVVLDQIDHVTKDMKISLNKENN